MAIASGTEPNLTKIHSRKATKYDINKSRKNQGREFSGVIATTRLTSLKSTITWRK
jgi:hypothetical protein